MERVLVQGESVCAHVVLQNEPELSFYKCVYISKSNFVECMLGITE